MNDTLIEIMMARREAVMELKKSCSLSKMKDKAMASPEPRPFKDALKNALQQKNLAIIAEIKKSSPSAGAFSSHRDTVQIAKDYEEGGATALSVLTEERWFGGKREDLLLAKKSVRMPILRKDFMLDEWQIYESRAYGADAILLIMAGLEAEMVMQLAEIARSLNLAILAEAHDQKELERALAIPDAIIGINSRNLKDLTIRHDISLALHGKIPKNRLAVAESGIRDKETFMLYRHRGARIFLMGEHFMRASHVGEALMEFVGDEIYG